MRVFITSTEKEESIKVDNTSLEGNSTPPYFVTVPPNYVQEALSYVQYLQLPSWCVDTFFMISIICISELITRLLWREMRYSLARRAILDFVTSVEVCFVSWEIITLFLAYNKAVFAIFCFLNLTQRAYRANFYSGVSCPYTHLLTYFYTRKDDIYGMKASEMGVRIASQFLGGLAAYRLNQWSWNLFLNPLHWYHSFNTSYGHCWTFLKVTTPLGFLIEMIGSLLCNLLSLIVYDMPRFPLGHHGRILTSSVGTLCLVLVAFSYTGGFYHPVIATVRTYGCRGFYRNLTTMDHVAVYWIGPTLGALSAHFIFHTLKRLLIKP